MKSAIELAREAGATEFGLKWVGFDGFVEKLITLTRADMLADLVKGAGQPVGDGFTTLVQTGDSPSTTEVIRIQAVGQTVYTAEAVAAAVAQASKINTDLLAMTQTQQLRIAELEAQLAAARQQGEQLIDCLEYGGRIFGDRSNPPKLLEVMAWLQSSKSAIDAAIRAGGHHD